MASIRPEIEATLLRKYIAYAQRRIFPIMTEEAKERITKFYLELRKQGEGDNAPIAVTARQLEGLVRLSEASAKMRLSEKVTPEDVEKTIGITMSSLKQVGMDNETGKLDIDILTVGVGRSQRERIKDLKNIIMDLSAEYGNGGVPADKILEKAMEHGLTKEKVEKEIKKLKEIGEIFEPKVGYYSHT
jgi:replicative DNA helicase Mcm